MIIKKIKKLRSDIKVLPAFGVAIVVSGNAMAAEFSFDEDWVLDVDTTVGAAFAQRLKDPDNKLLTGGGDGAVAINSDDGNRSFEKGDFFQKMVSVNLDADLQFQYQYGLFLRARAWKDYAYTGSSNHDGSPTCNAHDCSEYSDDVAEYHESRAELLDAFLYGTFQISDRNLSLRLGDQALSWGESLFIYGGVSSAQGPIDVTKTNTPGVALKEVFLPVGQLSMQFGLSDTFSLSGYYQYDWEKSRIDAPGTYFSPSDILGNGVNSLLLPAPPPAPPGTLVPVPYTEEEPDAGQFGVGGQYQVDALGGTEFGLYVLQYNDTVAITEADLSMLATGVDLYPDVPNNLNHKFFEDIKLVGLSAGGVIGITNFGAEISYRDGAPVQLESPFGFFFTEAKTAQAQISAVHVFGSNLISDNATLLAEVGGNRVLSFDPIESVPVPGQDFKLNKLDNDRNAWGYAANLEMDYFRILPKTDMKLKVSFKHDVNGVSSVPLSFAEGSKILGVESDLTYNNLNFGLSYTTYLTNVDKVSKESGLEVGHMLADRDYIAGYVKYTF